MAWVLIVVGKVFPRAAAVAASNLPPIGWLLRMAVFLQFHVAKLMACPLGSWGVIYAKYDIYASALVGVLHNNRLLSPLRGWDSLFAAVRLQGSPKAGR